jgi:hypothetical protein
MVPQQMLRRERTARDILQFHSIDIGFQAKSALVPPMAISSIFSIDYMAYNRTTLAPQGSLKSMF